MKWLLKSLGSSLGRKYVMAFTGFLLSGFLVSHLIGNLLIFGGRNALNEYAWFLLKNPLIFQAEAILLLLFLSHIYVGLRLSWDNYKARGNVGYEVKKKTWRGASLGSATMPYTGIIILISLIIHIWNFKYGLYYAIDYKGFEIRDFYRLVVETYSHPGWIAFYLVFVTAVGLHVSHGFHSLFQSLGLYHEKYYWPLKIISYIFAIAITVGFASIPLWSYFVKGGTP